jgi:hypothetical protein
MIKVPKRWADDAAAAILRPSITELLYKDNPEELATLRAKWAEEDKKRVDALANCNTLEQIKEWLGDGEEGYSQQETLAALQRALEVGQAYGSGTIVNKKNAKEW